MRAAYRELSSYQAATEIDLRHHPEDRPAIVKARRREEAGEILSRHNYDGVAGLVAEAIACTKGRISAQILFLPVA